MPNVFRQGDHICALYDTEEERVAVAAEYVADGLRRGERCYHVAESREAIDRLRMALRRGGIDVAEMVLRGALVEATHDEAHLAGGTFDRERMLCLLRDAIELATQDGFNGLRICGDMSWLLKDAPGSAQVVEYESFLNSFFEGVPALGMCQYDRRRLPPDLIDHALVTHKSAVLKRQHAANTFYRPVP